MLYKFKYTAVTTTTDYIYKYCMDDNSLYGYVFRSLGKPENRFEKPYVLTAGDFLYCINHVFNEDNSYGWFVYSESNQI